VTGNRKNVIPRLPYTMKVTMLAAVNCRERKISSGIIG
jgi:hypothetical protein